jgi:hypothetical protein
MHDKIKEDALKQLKKLQVRALLASWHCTTSHSQFCLPTIFPFTPFCYYSIIIYIIALCLSKLQWEMVVIDCIFGHTAPCSYPDRVAYERCLEIVILLNIRTTGLKSSGGC